MLARRIASFAVLHALGLLSLSTPARTQTLSTSTTTQHQIRDIDGGVVACVINIPVGVTTGADRLAIDIRAPKTPPPDVLAKLPASRRDFSTLPIQVFMVPGPAKGESVNPRLPQVVPVVSDLTLKRMGLTTDPDTDTFVRVEYPRGSVLDGVDLVAERTALSADGLKVTSQTRCRVRAVDALLWR